MIGCADGVLGQEGLEPVAEVSSCPGTQRGRTQGEYSDGEEGYPLQGDAAPVGASGISVGMAGRPQAVSQHHGGVKNQDGAHSLTMVNLHTGQVGQPCRVDYTEFRAADPDQTFLGQAGRAGGTPPPGCCR